MSLFLYIVFFLLCVILGGIILLQEGQGGGMGAAFGGVGGEAFGHGTGGINRFTTIVAVLFMVVALVIALVDKPTVL